MAPYQPDGHQTENILLMLAEIPVVPTPRGVTKQDGVLTRGTANDGVHTQSPTYCQAGARRPSPASWFFTCESYA
jgi:hypothetical protein